MGQADNTSLCTNHQKNVYFKKKIAVFFLYDFLYLYSVNPKYKGLRKTKGKKQDHFSWLTPW